MERMIFVSPIVREFYNLERIWASDAPPTARAATAS